MNIDKLNSNYNNCPYDCPIELSNGPIHIRYFDAIMDRDGTSYETPAGHTRGLVLMYARKMEISPEEAEELAVNSGGYADWLQEELDVIILRYEFYQGCPNRKQRVAILRLIEGGFVSPRYRRYR